MNDSVVEESSCTTDDLSTLLIWSNEREVVRSTFASVELLRLFDFVTGPAVVKDSVDDVSGSSLPSSSGMFDIASDSVMITEEIVVTTETCVKAPSVFSVVVPPFPKLSVEMAGAFDTPRTVVGCEGLFG